MRIPTDVSKTVNAYLAFRAILRAGEKYSGVCSHPLGLVYTVNLIFTMFAVGKGSMKKQTN